jgi:hypothetical protein
LPSKIDNADSRITSDALLFVVLPRSAFARVGLLAQICCAVVCLPVTKHFVAPVSSAFAAVKETDGNFNFQVILSMLHAL